VSASFLSGKISAFIVMFLLIFFLIFIIFLMRNDKFYVSTSNGNNSKNNINNNNINNNRVLFMGKSISRMNLSNKDITFFYVYNRLHSKFLLMLILNCSIMFLINIIYIRINLQYSQTIITIAQFSFGIFKIFWNGVVTPNMYDLIKKIKVDKITGRKTENKFMETMFLF
jgi:hypothetical protein